MNFQGKDYKLYEIYSKLAISNENKELLEEEIIKQGVDFSRIAFKEYRDELIKGHLEYAIESHDGKDGDGFIRQMYRIDRYQEEGEVDYCIGRIVDYDVPIKRFEHESDSNIEIGSIDLVSETMDKVYLIDVKGMNCEEPLHHAVYEIVTYFNMISRKKFIRDFTNATQNKFKYNHTKDDLIPAILMFENSKAYEDLKNENPDSLIGRLIYKYHIKFFILKNQPEYGVYKLIEE
jgi:hypothetical protein